MSAGPDGQHDPARRRPSGWPRALRRHAGRILAGLGVLLAVSAVLGADTAHRLSAGGYQYRDAATRRAVDVLASDFRLPADANLVVTVHGRDGVRSGAAAAAGRALADRIRAHPDVTVAADPWTAPPGSPLFSADGRTALVLVHVAGPERAAAATARKLADRAARTGGVEVGAAGRALVQGELTRDAQDALLRAELLAVPLTFLALLLAFRSPTAALLPLAVGVVAVTTTLALLRLLTAVVPVGVFALNLTTALGFGLAVDYSLFLLSRYRSERAAGHDRDRALDITARTAGRTVAYSALAVCAALLALLFFPVYALSSLAYAGLSVIAVAAVSAVTVVVCAVALLGDRGDRLLLPAAPPARAQGERWARLAALASARPWRWAVPSVLLLCALAAPFAHATFTPSDERMLRDTSAVAEATERIRTRFDPRDLDPVWLLLPPGSARDAGTAAYLRAVARTPGVARAAVLTSPGPAGRAVVRVVTAGAPSGDGAAATLARLRALPAPGPVTAVGGTVDRADTLAALAGRLPWALGFLAAGTFVLLFLFTGSVLMPVKALVLAALGLTVGMGVLVAVFQDGYAAFLLGDVSAPGYLDPSVVILVVCVCFGLATDYEMFLLSRLREHHLLTGDTRAAAVEAARRTSATISWSAVILITVLLTLAASPLTMLKMAGIGSALSVLVDAFVIRPVLVPAALAFFGPANWWAPPWLRRLHARVGPHEHPPAPPARTAPPARATSPHLPHPPHLPYPPAPSSPVTSPHAPGAPPPPAPPPPVVPVPARPPTPPTAAADAARRSTASAPEHS
ncbi:MMPL family transporter [Streptomyces termitum]|uniref:Membrane protein n=1 Tax=Streptomyces termitum TaxID=67368 RepID=A0A918T044_9ACTN|nr:MMPL family transporter [Streptomyces termitum]GHA82154.1 membrane protein [Streptomyces termitum]